MLEVRKCYFSAVFCYIKKHRNRAIISKMRSPLYRQLTHFVYWLSFGEDKTLHLY